MEAVERPLKLDVRGSVRLPALPGCLFPYAWSGVIAVGPERACARARDLVRTIAEEREYGPFLLESADEDMLRGDHRAAEAHAARAAAATSTLAEPYLLLARIRLLQDRAEEALGAADAGMRRDLRWSGGNWTGVFVGIELDALGRLGRTDDARDLIAWSQCFASGQPVSLCHTPLRDTWFSLWLAHAANASKRPPTLR